MDFCTWSEARIRLRRGRSDGVWVERHSPAVSMPLTPTSPPAKAKENDARELIEIPVVQSHGLSCLACGILRGGERRMEDERELIDHARLLRGAFDALMENSLPRIWGVVWRTSSPAGHGGRGSGGVFGRLEGPAGLSR